MVQIIQAGEVVIQTSHQPQQQPQWVIPGTDIDISLDPIIDAMKWITIGVVGILVVSLGVKMFK